ncbi:MAG TPA: DUF302 domain-containing protein [Thermohalobaculum sp.]|nr:DUF302 domain-containing protein [Thermohalobaculum sp.]
MRNLIVAVALFAAAIPATGAIAQSGGVTTYPVQAEFDDLTFGVETAIVGRGYVVDHISHVGEMLNRTAGDVGAAVQIYSQADIYLFCSAVLSRKMMEVDTNNLAHCPYSVFVYELANLPGTIHVGYRHMPEGAMQEVQELLDAIVKEAAGID